MLTTPKPPVLGPCTGPQYILGPRPARRQTSYLAGWPDVIVHRCEYTQRHTADRADGFGRLEAVGKDGITIIRGPLGLVTEATGLV